VCDDWLPPVATGEDIGLAGEARSVGAGKRDIVERITVRKIITII